MKPIHGESDLQPVQTAAPTCSLRPTRVQADEIYRYFPTWLAQIRNRSAVDMTIDLSEADRLDIAGFAAFVGFLVRDGRRPTICHAPAHIAVALEELDLFDRSFLVEPARRPGRSARLPESRMVSLWVPWLLHRQLQKKAARESTTLDDLLLTMIRRHLSSEAPPNPLRHQ